MLSGPDCGRIWAKVPGRSMTRCSDQNRISFQLQSAGVLRDAHIHVAGPNMTHGPEVAD
jgi:hypothetical protein